jgi:hypothetical protein
VVGAAEYQFIAWARAGIGALLEGSAAAVHLQLRDGEVAQTITPYGPGDVTALEARAVVRTVPSAGATDFEPNLFPSVELAHPGLPWLVSPPPDGQGRATPWIALVVVEDRPGVTLDGRPQILTIDAPASPAQELPDLTQAWAWAHGQTTGTVGAAIDGNSFARSTGEARGRLLAPRRLAPDRAYLACVVPVFAAGVAAALGGLPRSGLAWTGGETSVRLPVYFAWRFSTGPGGDFAALAKQVRPEALVAEVGRRTVDLSDPGWGMPVAPGATLSVTGALRAATGAPATTAAAIAIGDAIARELDAAADPTSSGTPQLAPPFYGATATGQERTSTAPTWQRALARDVGLRIAAGLGAAVVRANLDPLIDAAWRAAGDAERANAAIRHAELAAEVTQVLATKHIATLDSDGEAISIARPLLARMHARIGVPGRSEPLRAATGATADDATGPTLAAAVRASAMPDAVLSAGLRRLGRARGPLARAQAIKTGAVMAAVDARAIAPVPPKVLAAGAAGFDQVSQDEHERPRFHLATPAAVDSAAAAWRDQLRARRARAVMATPSIRIPEVPGDETPWTPIPISRNPNPDRREIDEFAAAAQRHQNYIVGKLEAISDVARPPLGNVHLGQPLSVIRAAVQAQWTAALGIAPLLGARLGSPGRRLAPAIAAPVPSFAPMRITPVLDQPLVHALQALAPAHVMPGVASIAPDRAALANAAPEFVRAFLVGANDELGRELLWRGYPGARGHTWLRTFWGRTVIGGDGAPVGVSDIPAIETWPDAGAAPAPATLILVVRAEVLRRYPNAMVYAVEGRWDGKHRVVGGGAPLAPVIAATLGGDVALFGFDLDRAVALGAGAPPGAAGWYFVIAEHPSEPRFGFAASSSGPPASWRDVAWSDVAAGDLAGNYLRVTGPLAGRTFPGEPLRWGSDAAAMAAITRRRAIRVAFHASTLLPPV